MNDSELPSGGAPSEPGRIALGPQQGITLPPGPGCCGLVSGLGAPARMPSGSAFTGTPGSHIGTRLPLRVSLHPVREPVGLWGAISETGSALVPRLLGAPCVALVQLDQLARRTSRRAPLQAPQRSMRVPSASVQQRNSSAGVGRQHVAQRRDMTSADAASGEVVVSVAIARVLQRLSGSRGSVDLALIEYFASCL